MMGIAFFLVLLALGFLFFIMWMVTDPGNDYEKNHTKHQRWRIFWAFVICGACLGCGVVFIHAQRSGLRPDYSKGARSGYVVKLSQKGFFFKSWEGEMSLAGDNASAAIARWEFTVREQPLVQRIEAAQREGKRVSLHYRQWLSSPWTMETDYEVVGVE